MVNGSPLLGAIDRIETLCRRDPGARGLASFAETSDLLAAATDLLASPRVLLVTGFCVRAAMIGETDGPPGTLALADALRALDKEVLLITDEHSSGLIAAGSPVFGGAPFPLLVLSRDQAAADAQIDDLLAAFAPTTVVAIERPGNAIDGHRYSMRGECLDDLVPAADRLLAPPGQRNYRTIAVGDGGNELGCGGLRERLMAHVEHGELIFCATPADYLIPAGVSNWGAFALVAALSLLSGKMLLRLPANERSVLQAIFEAGAVDGCTRRHEISVDGLGWDDYAATLTDIHAATSAALCASLAGDR